MMTRRHFVCKLTKARANNMARVGGINGCKKHGTGHCDDTWGTPLSSRGRGSASMMMMKAEELD